MEIKDILTAEEYNHLAQFKQEDRDWINERIQIRKDGKAGVECVVRGLNGEGDYFELTPEEIVRQYYAYKLMTEYHYKKEQLSFEEPVIFAGKQVIMDKRIDIAVFDKDLKKIDMIIEVKRPEVSDYHKTWDAESTTPFQQMQSYCIKSIPRWGCL
mgnify:FL=1